MLPAGQAAGERELVALLDHCFWLLRILGPGSVIQANVFSSGYFETQGDNGSGNA